MAGLTIKVRAGTSKGSVQNYSFIQMEKGVHNRTNSADGTLWSSFLYGFGILQFLRGF